MSDFTPIDHGFFTYDHGHREYELRLVQSEYRDGGRPAFVTFNKDGEPWTHLTVNLPDIELGPFEVVGDHNSATALRILEQHPAFTMTDRKVKSGFVTYNIWVFDPAKLKVS
jgi:hypothetical protein